MQRKGFTLIELLIVITIIGILAVALIPRIAGAPARARDVQRKADLGNILAAFELYYTDNGFYFEDGGAPASHCMTDFSGMGSAVKIYLQGETIPPDPSGLTTFCPGGVYVASVFPDSGGSNPEHVAIVADLEIDTATGDGIYCDIDDTPFSSKAEFDAALASWTCDGTGDAYYIVSR